MSKDGLRTFFSKFKEIYFDKESSDFEFRFDYNDFTYKAEGTKTAWTISTRGTRIVKSRSEEANGNWTSKTVYPTEIIRSVLEKAGLEYDDGRDLRKSITSIDNAADLKEIYYGFKLALQLRNSTLASEANQEDYIISPVKNAAGYYFDSRNAGNNLPLDADANGAYNIALKGLYWVTNDFPMDGDYLKYIKDTDWFEFIQTKPYLKTNG
jgi:CRISPR-associated protein Cpf1